MVIDPSTGRIEWAVDVRGVHPVVVLTTDPFGAVARQSFLVTVSVERPPLVDAGPDLFLAQAGQEGLLDGIVWHHSGEASPAPLVEWKLVEGPGAVLFADSASTVTPARFDTTGTYLLELSAEEGSFGAVADRVLVHVGERCGLSLPEGAIGWWPFDVDLSEKLGRQVSVRGQTRFVDGKVDRGLARLPGEPRLSLGLPDGFTEELASPEGFSIEFWMRSAPLDDGTILDLGPELDLRIVNRYTRRYFTVRSRNAEGAPTELSTDSILTGLGASWMHLAVVYDREAGTMRLYREGLPDGVAQVGDLPLVLADQISIGPNWAGELDELTFYDRPLEPVEIYEIANAEGGKCLDAENAAPTADPGPPFRYVQVGETFSLNGSIRDDGKPFGIFDGSWSSVDGTGMVDIADSETAVTTATVSEPGLYLLEFTASDGARTARERIEVRAFSSDPANPDEPTGPEEPVEPPNSLAASWTGDYTNFDEVSGILLNTSGVGYREGVSSGAFAPLDADVLGLAFADSPALRALGFSGHGFTIDFWLRFRNSYNREMLSLGEGLVLGASRGSLVMKIKDSNGAGGDFRAYKPPSAANDGWTHIAMVVDPLDATALLYQDGEIVGGGDISGLIDVNTDGRLRWFTGTNFDIDEFSIHSFPLAEEEIIERHADGFALKPAMAVNTAPSVDCGDDRRVRLGESLRLVPAVSDDGLPLSGPGLGYSWSQVAGPGAAAFLSPQAVETELSFDAPGEYRLRLDVDDSLLATSDELLVTVVEDLPPEVSLTQPGTSLVIEPGDRLQLIARASDAFGSVSQVEFFIDGQALGSATPAGGDEYFLGPLGFDQPGRFELTARATDEWGQQAIAEPRELLVVDDPGYDLQVDLDKEALNERVTAPSPVRASIRSEILKSWRLERRLIGEDGWTLLESGRETAVNETIATFDPSLLLNGLYLLRLSAEDVFGRVAVDETTVAADGSMKVGHFALAFEDLTVPLSGIPIQVVRSYDSRDTRSGDFGTGWTLAVNDVHVQTSGVLGADWFQEQVPLSLPGAGDTLGYCLEPIGKRLISVTFPGGGQHLFEMAVDVGHGRQDIEDNCQLFIPIENAGVVFRPRGNTTSQLEAVESSEVFCFGSIRATSLYSSDPQVDFGARVYDPTRFILTTADGTRYLLDEDEGLVSMEDLNGNTLEVFDDRIVSTAQDPNGGADIVREVTFLRDGEGRITRIIDPDGNTLEYGYEAGKGGLRTFTNRVDETTEFRYEDARHPDYLTDILDPRGVRAIRTEYDDEGCIARQIDADGNPIDFEHDLDGFAETVTDRLGHRTTYYYDELGNVTRQVDPDAAETLFEYYPGTELVKYETDDLGHVIARAYDSRENLLVEITGASIGEEPADALTDAATTGFVTRYAYNEFSSPTEIVDPEGNRTEFTYDDRGNLLAQIQHGSTTPPLVTTFTYHPSGDIQTITDAEGNVTDYDYAYGISDPEFPSAVKRQTVTVTDAEHGVLKVTESLYDQQENLLVERYNRTLANGQTEVVSTSYLYDEENRLVATILPDGQVAETRYNDIGKEAATIRWQSVSDYQNDDLSLARVTTMEYDARGNLVRTVYPDGTETGAVYDAEGRQVSATDQAGRTTYMLYDALGRQTHTIHPDDTMPPDPALLDSSSAILNSPLLDDNPTTETIYDSIGRVEFTIDAIGNLTQNIYAEPGEVPPAGETGTVGNDDCACAGRLQATRAFPDPEDTGVYLETSYAYDANGNQRFVTDPKGNVTEFVYDAFNRLTETRHPATAEHGATSTTTEYDPLGRRIATVDEEGRRTEYAYDALGRLTEVRQEHPTENWETGNWTTTSYT